MALKTTEMDDLIYSDFVANGSDKRLRNLAIKTSKLYPTFPPWEMNEQEQEIEHWSGNLPWDNKVSAMVRVLGGEKKKKLVSQTHPKLEF